MERNKIPPFRNYRKQNNNTYADLKYIYDPLQKVEVAFYKLNDLVIEVVSPSSSDSPIIKALENKSFLSYLFSVPNIKKALDFSIMVLEEFQRLFLLCF